MCRARVCTRLDLAALATIPGSLLRTVGRSATTLKIATFAMPAFFPVLRTRRRPCQSWHLLCARASTYWKTFGRESTSGLEKKTIVETIWFLVMSVVGALGRLSLYALSQSQILTQIGSSCVTARI